MEKVTSIESPAKSRRRRSSKHGRRDVAMRADDQFWQKSSQAYELRAQGKSFTQIAEILGVPDKTEVGRLISERYAFDAAYLSSLDRSNLLAMELIRLDKLQDAIWPAAMMGDPKSVDSALKIIQTRARITGLESVDPVVNKNLVLVMGEKEEDYIKQLQAISDD